MYKLFSTEAGRTDEPGFDELRPERPMLVDTIPDALSERGLSDDEIAGTAGFASAGDNHLFRSSPRACGCFDRWAGVPSRSVCLRGPDLAATVALEHRCQLRQCRHVRRPDGKRELRQCIFGV